MVQNWSRQTFFDWWCYVPLSSSPGLSDTLFQKNKFESTRKCKNENNNISMFRKISYVRHKAQRQLLRSLNPMALRSERHRVLPVLTAIERDALELNHPKIKTAGSIYGRHKCDMCHASESEVGRYSVSRKQVEPENVKHYIDVREEFLRPPYDSAATVCLIKFEAFNAVS